MARTVDIKKDSWQHLNKIFSILSQEKLKTTEITIIRGTVKHTEVPCSGSQEGTHVC